MEVDSFDDELEKMANFCESMDIDSFEEMSDRGNEQELVVGNFGSFSFGYVPNLKEGSFKPVVTGAGSPVVSIPFTPSFGVFSPPSCGVVWPPSSIGVFLKDTVPSDCVPVTGTKFETSVSEERGLTSLPEPQAPENLAPGKENVSVSLVEETTSSPSRRLVKEPSSRKPMLKVSSVLRARPTASSTTATASARPSVEDPFNSKPLNTKRASSSVATTATTTATTTETITVTTVTTTTATTVTTPTTTRHLVEDPFDSKPLNPKRTVSTSSSSTTNTTTKKASTKSILDALFDDAEEEEEPKKKKEKENKRLNKKDGRKVIRPKLV